MPTETPGRRGESGEGPGIQALAAELAKEIVQLLESGENWQVVLHGGRGGDVVMEVKRTRQLVPPRKRQSCDKHER